MFSFMKQSVIGIHTETASICSLINYFIVQKLILFARIKKVLKKGKITYKTQTTFRDENASEVTG